MTVSKEASVLSGTSFETPALQAPQDEDRGGLDEIEDRDAGKSPAMAGYVVPGERSE